MTNLTLRKSGGLLLVELLSSLLRCSTIFPETNSKYPTEMLLVMASTMTRMMTVNQLNMSSTVAAENARLNSSLEKNYDK